MIEYYFQNLLNLPTHGISFVSLPKFFPYLFSQESPPCKAATLTYRLLLPTPHAFSPLDHSHGDHWSNWQCSEKQVLIKVSKVNEMPWSYLYTFKEKLAIFDTWTWYFARLSFIARTWFSSINWFYLDTSKFFSNAHWWRQSIIITINILAFAPVLP